MMAAETNAAEDPDRKTKGERDRKYPTFENLKGQFGNLRL
jgi:hypothetical protein